MKKVKLKSSYPCLVKTQNECYDIDENDLLEIEDEKRLLIYPLNSSKKCYPFYINLSELKSCHNYTYCQMSDFDFILLNQAPNLKVCNKEYLKVDSEDCQISICENTLTFETRKSKVEYDCSHLCNNYKVFKIKNYACLDVDEHYLYCFNVKTNKLSLIYGDELEIDKDQIKISKLLNDCENTSKTCSYIVKDNEIALENYSFERTSQNLSPQLSPYRFLDSIKIKDYAHAKNFLSPSLNEKIDEKKLADFFGNILSFLPLSTQEFIVISSTQKNFVRFDTNKDFICDIAIDKLG